MNRTVGIFLFPEVEALDFAGPFEVFTTCSRVARRLHPQQAEPFTTFSIAETLQPVRARAGLRITPDHRLDDHPPVDVLIVPGGVIDAQLHKPEVLQWLRRCSQSAQLVASVCTGAFILAKAGVLEDGPVTTHWEDQADLAAMFPALQVQDGPRWIDQGRRVTSAGIAAGIDMCLHLVERLCSSALASATARQMDYPWQPGTA
ncbi:DJ-1/PfpI family protein [Pseudomonas mangrovi]|uniref:Thiamine biosynthesis protein ThiJ n=1 Tax=Pseudomonas mangrovi TaxID=2161748 RepID=A0A2T5PBT3_9PSED|nr:DJ-1/PfpI family protein [Pseudomonas mangrovi]PTU75172.1 thiamine biosynthesis protein ThiJ [Pseudomonas mangrovi]